jgi:predicted ATPase/DNA-binding XRE family transcriptional regulator
MGDDPPGAFGVVLRRFRVAAGLTQEALAERAGLSVDAIAALERGRRTRPRAFTLGVLAETLGLDADDRAKLMVAAAGQASPGGPVRLPLPTRLTTFVGRQRELAEVERLLGQARLLTLFGPGGTGKTRLALAAAERQPDPCWFVPLDTCPEPELVGRAVAGAVGAREVPGTPLAEWLQRHVADLDGLLILDNCEHVAAATAELAHGLLRSAPRLRLLATSREVLRVPGETTWQVPALPEADAVRLFADRAALAAPGFMIGPGNADAVTRVCRVLDGIPLAIELAAPRSRTLTPAQLADRLVDAFAVLTTGVRTAPPRHQTLRATVDWSYQLLEPQERRLFGVLSLFAGGFYLEAAEAVWGGPVLEPLGALVDRSLVLAEPDGEAMRYRLLEVLRQYGQARLAESGHDDVARRRHLEHYLSLARQLPMGLQDRADQRGWLPRFRVERANFDAALHWAASRPDTAGQAGAALAYALAPFWLADGSINEGSARVEAALASAQGDLRADILRQMATFAFRRGDYATAVTRMQESTDIKRAAGDVRGAALGLNMLGLYRIAAGEPGARPILEQARATLTEHGDQRAAAESNLFLGIEALADGDLAAAEHRLGAAADVYRAAGDHARLIACRGCLCLLRLETGDLAGASAIWAEMRVLVVGPLQGMHEEAGWLWTAMLITDAHGQQQAALRLLGAIDARAQRGLQFIEPLRRRCQPVADRLRARIGPGAPAALRAEGAALMAEGAAMSPAELAALPGDG